MQIAVHVHPGSKHPRVGGSHGGSLIVRVRSRAVDGAATAEVVRSLAHAFEVRVAAVEVLRGAKSREKIIVISGDDLAIAQQLRLLMDRDLDDDGEER